MPFLPRRRAPLRLHMLLVAGAGCLLVGCAGPTTRLPGASTTTHSLEARCKADAGVLVHKKVLLPPLQLGGFSAAPTEPFQLRPEDRYVFETSRLELDDDAGAPLGIVRVEIKVWDSLKWELLGSSTRYCQAEGAPAPSGCCPEAAAESLREAVFAHSPVKSPF